MKHIYYVFAPIKLVQMPLADIIVDYKRDIGCDQDGCSDPEKERRKKELCAQSHSHK